MTRIAAVLATAFSTIALGTSIFVDPSKRLIWNASASAPIGLYFIQPADDLDVTDLVAVAAPPLIAEFLSDRGYLPLGMPMMKRVLALPGETVCRHGLDIIAYRSKIGHARERDKAGREMPVWQGCRRIGDEELFLMNFDVPDSVDGRYFGPFPRASIIGRAQPVWTDEADDGRFQWWAATR
ncbi:MAG: S26 family signal peptidase [Pseudorhodoplanes sp.]|uniref:S26 family signal peptidase n=1 Tax=Pseudorhodoplanes sp. TaxID=1934341 RepID=UPI003D0EAA30